MFFNQKPIPIQAKILKSVKVSFAVLSSKNGIKLLSLAPIAIPLFSINKSLKKPRSIIGISPYIVRG